MTNATITPIGKYLQFRGSSARSTARTDGPPSKTNPSHGRRLKNQPSKDEPSGGDWYEKRAGRAHLDAPRLSRQNQIALSVRSADRKMQQISSRIDKMEEALHTLVEHSPPYPAGSRHRKDLLKKVNTFRKQIEMLTFPPSADQYTHSGHIRTSTPGPGIDTLIEAATDGGKEPLPRYRTFTENGSSAPWMPELTESADDSEISLSIARLKKAGALIRRQRDHLQSETSALYQGRGISMNNETAEFKSLFIGKHLSRHPDTDLTTTSSIWTGY